MDSSSSSTAQVQVQGQVQHVNKKSSDELLRKFAEDSDDGSHSYSKQVILRVSRRQKRSSIKLTRKRSEAGDCHDSETPSASASISNNGVVERKWLLPPGPATRRLRARDVKNKSIFRTIQKTWRRTLDGASKVFIDKHYNRHRRLISDAVV